MQYIFFVFDIPLSAQIIFIIINLGLQFSMSDYYDFNNFVGNSCEMKQISAFILVLWLTITLLRAEINVGNSVEWLCADAGMIARGILQSHTKCINGNNTFSCTFSTGEILRGSTANPVTFIISNYSDDSLKKFELQKTPLLIFLKEFEKNIKCQKSETSWQVMECYNSIPAMINLDTPPKLILSAQGFLLLEIRETIISYCRIVLSKIAEYEIMGHTVFMNYLEIPTQSTIFNILYQGSSCYLSVPHFMFPESKEKLY
jgi:hypothetical protein